MRASFAVFFYLKTQDDKAEIAEKVAKTLGLENVDTATIERLAGIFSQFATLPKEKIDLITSVLEAGN